MSTTTVVDVQEADQRITCPRRIGEWGPWKREENLDAIDSSDDTCSFCGSLNPDTFMARLEAGDVELGSTDKSYKVYVHNRGGAMFKQTYRDCYSQGANDCKGPDTCTHWVTRERDETKFYFQHLSVEQRQRFIQLLNENKIAMHGGFGFYVLPFFIKRG